MFDPDAFLSRRTVLGLLGVASAQALLSARADAADNAVLAWTPGPSTPQISLALQRGLWERHGLTVKPVAFPTGREALEALLGGGADFASLAEFPVVTAALRAQKFAVLASLSVFVGNRLIINGASGAKDMAGLAGRKVGVTLGTNMQYLAARSLKGIRVEYVNVAPGDLVPALARRDIDAAFMFDSFYPQARAVLGANYVEVMTPEYQGQFLVTASRAYLDSKPAAVGAFLAALLAADEMVTDMGATAAAVSAATGGTLSVAAITAQRPNYRFEVNINGELLPLLADQGAWINSTGLIQTPASRDLLRGYIADSHLAKLAPRRVAL